MQKGSLVHSYISWFLCALQVDIFDISKSQFFFINNTIMKETFLRVFSKVGNQLVSLFTKKRTY